MFKPLSDAEKKAFLTSFSPPPMGNGEKLGIKLLSRKSKGWTFAFLALALSLFFYFVVDLNLLLAFFVAIAVAIFSGIRVVPAFKAGVPKFLFLFPCRGEEVELKPGSVHWMPLHWVIEVSVVWEKFPIKEVEVLTGSAFGQKEKREEKVRGRDAMIVDLKINPAVVSARVKPGKAFYSLMIADLNTAIQTLAAMSLRQSASRYSNPEEALFAHSEIGKKLTEYLQLFGEAVGVEFAIPPGIAPIEDIDAKDPKVVEALQAEAIADYTGQGTIKKQVRISELLKEHTIAGVSKDKQYEFATLDLLDKEKVKKTISETRTDIGDLTTAANLPMIGNVLQGIFGKGEINYEKMGDAIGKGLAQALKDAKKEE